MEFLVKYEIEPPVVGARPTYVEHEGVVSDNSSVYCDGLLG